MGSVPQERTQLRFRQIHLDFHTSPTLADIGRDFDPQRFARTLQDAHVNLVTCFSRCHHGWLYYDSKRFPELVHPNLVHRDLLREQIEACHKAGIKVPIYTTVQWDAKVAAEHREWLVSDESGAPFRQPVFAPGFYANLCLNTGYRDYLKALVMDLFENFAPLDGLFLDILNIQPCCCPKCVADMRARGLDASDETVRYEFAQEVMDDFKRDMSAYIRSFQKDCPIFYNVGFINTRHRQAIDTFTHLEIESLPGGPWGYNHFPVAARYARTLGLEFQGMTGRFFTDWGDFGSIRNKAALEYECFRTLAYGGKCSIGDHLHPYGKLPPAVYGLIGEVYRSVEAKEPWCEGARPVVEAGVLIPEEFMRAGTKMETSDLVGAVKLLIEIGLQFDVIDTKADFSAYRLLVLPDNIPVSKALQSKIEAFLKAGGKVLASYRSGLGPDGDYAAFIPASLEGEAPFSPDFIAADGPLAEGLAPGYEHVMYIKGLKVRPRPGAAELLGANVPFANRTWEHYSGHRHFPSSQKHGYPAALEKDGVVFFAHPIFETFQQYGCPWIRTMVANAIKLLIGDTIVQHQGPTTLEVEVSFQPRHDRTVVHLLHYIPLRRAEKLDIIEDTIPLRNVPLSIDLEGRPVRSVRLVPQGGQIPYKTEGGRLCFTAPEVCGHQMVEIQHS